MTHPPAGGPGQFFLVSAEKEPKRFSGGHITDAAHSNKKLVTAELPMVGPFLYSS